MTRGRHHLLLPLCGAMLIAALASAGCASRGLKLPEGPGEPFPGYEQALAEATGKCAAITSLAAEARVAGSVGGGKVRGRVILGFERQGRMRLEGVAPIGAPAFILAAEGGTATLLMPRAREVLRNEPTERVLEALIGLRLTSDDLLAILAGCGVAPGAAAVSGRQYAGDWVSVEVERNGIAYLHRESGTWRMRAALRPSLRVEYDTEEAPTPTVVRLEAREGERPAAQLRLTLSQVETNGAIPPNAFQVTIPPGAATITLDDLRQAGPLGERR